MNYEELIGEAKNLFIERLKSQIPEEAYKANPELSKEEYREVVFSEIMALGYNHGNIKKASEDLYQIKANTHGEGRELYDEIYKGLQETAEKYANEVQIFSRFHLNYQNGLTEDQIAQVLRQDFGK